MQLIPLFALAGVALGQTFPDLAKVLIDNQDRIKTLTDTVMKYPDLVSTLAGLTNITILAPTNTAFKSFLGMNRTKEATAEDIKNILSYHVLDGTYPSSAFEATPKFLPSILGEYPRFRNLSGRPQVIKAVEDNSMPCMYGGLGVRAAVEKPDIKFAGGIVHIIDTVILPPMKVSDTAKGANLTSFAGALDKASLVGAADELAGATIFAPTNAAFQAIGNVLKNMTESQLFDVMAYHVSAKDVFYSTSLKNNQTIRTQLRGKLLTITIEGGNIFVNGARIIMSDVLTNGGVIHVIDGVLNPNNTNDAPEPTALTQQPAFASATAVKEAPFTSGTTTGAVPGATAGVGRLGMSSILVFVGAGAFALGMIA